VNPITVRGFFFGFNSTGMFVSTLFALESSVSRTAPLSPLIMMMLHNYLCISLVIVATSASITTTATASQQQQQQQQRQRYIPSSLVHNDVEENQWVSLHPDVEFLPSNYYNDKSPHDTERLATATQQFLAYSDNTRHRGTRKAQQLRTLEEGDAADAAEEEQPASTSSGREDNAQYRVQPFVEGVSDYDAYQQAWRMLGFMIDCNTISSYNNNNNNNQNNNNGHSNDNEDGTGEGCTRYVLWAAVRLRLRLRFRFRTCRTSNIVFPSFSSGIVIRYLPFSYF
jgi:hypothetical protein